jgi:nitrogen-specific signal transduction histidine kinase
VGKFIPVEPEKWAEMVKAQAEVARLEHLVNYWKVEAETDNARWLRVLEENDRLKAEVERLNNESDILQKCCEHQKNRIERLKAEVEQLTRAGDAMEMTLQADFNGCPYEPTIVREAMIYWRNSKNAAKKGGQS